MAFPTATLLVGCGPEAGSSAEGPSEYPYKVTATVGMISDIVQEVAGPKAQVEGLIGEGVDPHVFKATSADRKSLQAADIIFYNGLLLEGKMVDVLMKVANRGKQPVVAVTEEIQAKADYVITDDEDHDDPHVWMDVKGWIEAVKVVESALSKWDEANKIDYEQNARGYIAKLEELDAYAKKAIGSIPEAQRVLVTAHDAFGYMSRAYGIEVKAIQGISTESKPGLKDIEELVEYLVSHRIPAIFVESSVDPANVKALVEGARARGHEIKIGGELFSDAMGPAGTYEGTYIGMIDHNVTTIARALGGKAPHKGMNGKLSHGEK